MAGWGVSAASPMLGAPVQRGIQGVGPFWMFFRLCRLPEFTHFPDSAQNTFRFSSDFLLVRFALACVLNDLTDRQNMMTDTDYIFGIYWKDYLQNTKQTTSLFLLVLVPFGLLGFRSMASSTWTLSYLKYHICVPSWL